MYLDSDVTGFRVVCWKGTKKITGILDGDGKGQFCNACRVQQRHNVPAFERRLMSTWAAWRLLPMIQRSSLQSITDKKKKNTSRVVLLVTSASVPQRSTHQRRHPALRGEERTILSAMQHKACISFQFMSHASSHLTNVDNTTAKFAEAHVYNQIDPILRQRFSTKITHRNGSSGRTSFFSSSFARSST